MSTTVEPPKDSPSGRTPCSPPPWFGDGYRLLADGDVVVDGDEYSLFGQRGWVRHTKLIGQLFSLDRMQHTRRRLESPGGCCGCGGPLNSSGGCDICMALG